MRPARYHAVLCASLALALGLPALARELSPRQAAERLFEHSLEANRKGFAGRTGRVEGFGAGDAYPQIWLRDSATLLPLARWHYPRATLQSWLEEHLAHQAPDGSLNDWIAAGVAARFQQWAPRARDVWQGAGVKLAADRNTTEADQEASAVDAAYRIWRLTGDTAWLDKRIAGRSVLERLSGAMRFVFERRYDGSRGLATSAFTADWGDVSPVHPDQRAIYLDARTPRVAGLYTNAMVYRAAQQLAEMHAAWRDAPRSREWQTRASGLRYAVNRHLWDAERGFYRMHLVLIPERLPPGLGSEGVFALGGNAMAVLAGLASDEQARRIFDAAEARRREAGLEALGATLLPPFAAGLFAHPAMREPWRYQNGGQWDWFAGRLVLAEFERGFSSRAAAHLDALLQRAIRNDGFYEWYDRKDRGQGSPRYAGGAAAVAEALYAGLFGIRLQDGGLALRVRLQDRSDSVRLRQPATETDLSYSYRFEPAARRILLGIESTARPGAIAIAVPAGFEAREASVGSQPIALRLELLGDDRYVVVGPPAAFPALIEIRLEPPDRGR